MFRCVLERYGKSVVAEMEENQDLKEKVEQTLARVNLAVAKYCLVLLQKSREKAMAKERGEADDGVDEVVEETLELELDSKRFPGLEIDPAIEEIPHKLATDFEEARALFLPCQRALNLAKAYYTLQDHCTDFVEASQEHSHALRVVAFFEQDLDRKFKIHKKRVALLEEPLQALSRQMYLLVRLRSLLCIIIH